MQHGYGDDYKADPSQIETSVDEPGREWRRDAMPSGGRADD